MWSDYSMSPAVLRKSPTMGMTSVLYREEEALFCAYAVASLDVYQDTNGYLRDSIHIACHYRH